MPKAAITNIIFGTMTLGYRGYGARVHDAATADAMLAPSWNLATTSLTRALPMAMEPANRCWVISAPPNGSASPRGFIPETLAATNLRT